MKNKFFIISIGLLFAIVVFFVNGDSNGVWNYAEDLKPGIVGDDEANLGDKYVFVNRVEFNGTARVNTVPVDEKDVANKEYIDAMASSIGSTGFVNSISCIRREGYSLPPVPPGYAVSCGFADNICCYYSLKPYKNIENAYRVFVTSRGYDGNLGGELGADAKCQDRADYAGLDGNFKAWLVDGVTNTDIRDKFEDHIYVNMLGQVILYTFYDFKGEKNYWANEDLLNNINYDEYGVSIIDKGHYFVWTGLDTDGTSYGHNCDGFTSNLLIRSSMVGDTRELDSDWYSYTLHTNKCGAEYSLICFEY